MSALDFLVLVLAGALITDVWFNGVLFAPLRAYFEAQQDGPVVTPAATEPACEPPSAYIVMYAKKRHWDRDKTAFELAWSRDRLDAVLDENAVITLHECDALHRVFGDTAALWLKIDNDYRAARAARAKSNTAVSDEAGEQEAHHPWWMRFFDRIVPGWLAYLLTCRYCFSFHAVIWPALLLYVPSLFLVEPWCTLLKVPLYVFAAIALSNLYAAYALSTKPDFESLEFPDAPD